MPGNPFLRHRMPPEYNVLQGVRVLVRTGKAACPDAWLARGGFEAFLADVGRRPAPGLELRRRDRALPYSRENCFWGVPARGRPALLTAFGRSQGVAAWAREVGLHRNTLFFRLASGWPLEKALTWPRAGPGVWKGTYRPADAAETPSEAP